MYTKLAKRNMIRSLKDYTIYFLTLVFGVCIFYTFNSIGSQRVMMKLNEYETTNFNRVDMVMGVVSIFIACILGFLIIYANNYLIKRRKKEFGVYLTLGIDNRKVSNILLFETILIGVFSLGVGLFLGVFLSQGMSIFTAKLFHVEMESFKFTFSSSAFIKTIVYFGVMYLIVFLFNIKTIRKLELIDLLSSGRKNEMSKLKTLRASIIIFIVSNILIGISYFMILQRKSDIFHKIMIIPILLVVIGTFLFFFSLSGFLLRLTQNNKKIYLKELNMFLLRQINSKINTTFMSMALICLMLFVSICMLSGGFSISNSINKNIDDLSQYDLSILYGDKVPLKDYLDKYVKLGEYSDEFVIFNQYYNKTEKEDLGIKDYIGKAEGEKYRTHRDVTNNSIIPIMKLSDFNSIMKLSKKEGITLNNGEYGICGNITELLPTIQKTIDSKRKISVNGQELIPSQNHVIEVTLVNDLNKSNFGIFIVRDEVVEGLTIGCAYLNINFNVDKAKGGEDFLNDLPSMEENYKRGVMFSPTAKDELRATSFGVQGMISYLSLYIGIIFLITSAVILSLQQLSEAADNAYRYNLLRKIGVDDEMINKTILKQISIYFMMPLILALIHSIIGLKVFKIFINILGTGNVIGHLLTTTFIFVIIYGGYFWITYVGVKKMVK